MIIIGESELSDNNGTGNNTDLTLSPSCSAESELRARAQETVEGADAQLRHQRPTLPGGKSLVYFKNLV